MTTRRTPVGNTPDAGMERTEPDLPRAYRRAGRFAERGRSDQARRLYATLGSTVSDLRLKALIANDLAVLSARDGDLDAARTGLEAALSLDSQCEPARLNAALLQAERASALAPPITGHSTAFVASARPPGPVRVAILSFLFNWPSTGGGIVHTVELARSPTPDTPAGESERSMPPPGTRARPSSSTTPPGTSPRSRPGSVTPSRGSTPTGSSSPTPGT